MTASSQFSAGSQRIVHVTAAAAAKAAATALLTNQVVRRVRVSLLDGRTASFKVDKCVLESNSALCSVIGTRLGVSDVPEVCVRVAWEEVIATTSNQIAPASLYSSVGSPPEEVIWLQLDPEKISLSSPAMEVELLKLIPLRQIPLFLHFEVEENSTSNPLQELPRELLAEAVREALALYPTQKLEQGVRVFVSLVNSVGEATASLPKLQVTEVVPALFDTPPANLLRLALALDTFGNNALSLLLDDADGETLVDLAERRLSLKAIFDQLGAVASLTTLTIGGGPGAIVAIASGNLSGDNYQKVDSFFVAAIAQRKDLDSVTVQNLREISDPQQLIQFLNRRRLGWLFDEFCRLACVELRKRLTRSLCLELLAVGATGAVLGRALIEPATFKL